MPKWLKITFISLGSVFLFTLIVLIWNLVKITLGKPVIINLRPDFNLQINKDVLQTFEDEVGVINPNFDSGKIIILISPAYKETVHSAGVRGTSFMFSEWGSYLKIPVLKVYINKKLYKGLDRDIADGSARYFLIRQILLNQGITKKVNNDISYKFGISTPQLFKFTKIF